MTSEMGEMFNEYKKERQEKRELNREQSRQLLIEHGVHFEEKNNGAHLIVETYDGLRKADFWPGTGKFHFRDARRAGRGVLKLLKFLGYPKPDK